MRVFDFDNTIYKGESSFDFAFYLAKKKKKLIFYLPKLLWLLFLYKSCRMSTTSFQEKLNKKTTILTKHYDFIMDNVGDFWLDNIEKLYPHMLRMIKEEDVIITTCPDFLIAGVKDVLNTKNILATTMKNKKIKYLNYQENKVKNYLSHYPHEEITELYTDSYNDQPLMDIAKKVFLVKNGVIKQIK